MATKKSKSEDVRVALEAEGFHMTELAGNIAQYLKTQAGVDVIVHSHGAPPTSMEDPVEMVVSPADGDENVVAIRFPSLRAFLAAALF